MNCITTRPFRNTIPRTLFFNFPFNTVMGLKDERTNAGYSPESKLPTSHNINNRKTNHGCSRDDVSMLSPDRVWKGVRHRYTKPHAIKTDNKLTSADSVRNWRINCVFTAPTTLRMPTSLARSRARAVERLTSFLHAT